MLTATDDRVLLTVRPAFLVVPAPGLPDGVQLRVRAAPEGTAAEVGPTAYKDQLSPGVVPRINFEGMFSGV